MADQESTNIRTFAAPNRITVPLSHLRDILGQYLETRERQVIRHIRDYAVIGEKNRVLGSAVQVGRKTKKYKMGILSMIPKGMLNQPINAWCSQFMNPVFYPKQFNRRGQKMQAR